MLILFSETFRKVDSPGWIRLPNAVKPILESRRMVLAEQKKNVNYCNAMISVQRFHVYLIHYYYCQTKNFQCSWYLSYGSTLLIVRKIMHMLLMLIMIYRNIWTKLEQKCCSIGKSSFILERPIPFCQTLDNWSFDV